MLNAFANRDRLTYFPAVHVCLCAPRSVEVTKSNRFMIPGHYDARVLFRINVRINHNGNSCTEKTVSLQVLIKDNVKELHAWLTLSQSLLSTHS